MARTALGAQDLAAVDALLAEDDRLRTSRYPGDDGSRQPVHTVYVPADRVTAGLVREWSQAALLALDTHLPDGADPGAATGLDADAVQAALPAVRRKLEAEPIEDLRVDLEDGYGTRTDEAEDADAVAAARALATARETGSLPPYVGIRFKSLEGPTRRRGIRTLDLVLGTLLAAGDLPAGWVVTLPKVTSVAQVVAMVELCRRLERAHGLPEGALRFEVQVETAQAVLGADGSATVAALVHAADGRCTGLHFGTYDYTAGLGVPAAHQALDHPAADHAKAVLQLAAAGTGVRVSDGSTNLLPVGTRAHVHRAWRLHARLVTRSLERGFYQGWDLHPAQLPTRYLATYVFFADGHRVLADRLADYLAGTGGGVLDEPATAAMLAASLLRGVRCGALDEAEVCTRAGTDLVGLGDLAARRPPGGIER